MCRHLSDSDCFVRRCLNHITFRAGIFTLRAAPTWGNSLTPPVFNYSYHAPRSQAPRNLFTNVLADAIAFGWPVGTCPDDAVYPLAVGWTIHGSIHSAARRGMPGRPDRQLAEDCITRHMLTLGLTYDLMDNLPSHRNADVHKYGPLHGSHHRRAGNPAGIVTRYFNFKLRRFMSSCVPRLIGD